MFPRPSPAVARASLYSLAIGLIGIAGACSVQVDLGCTRPGQVCGTGKRCVATREGILCVATDGGLAGDAGVIADAGVDAGAADGGGAPVPSVTAISPDVWKARGGSFTLTVSGTDFVSRSVIRWNGTPRTTTFMSDGELHATIADDDISLPEAVEITVYTAPPGGGISSPRTLVLTPPVGVFARASIASNGAAADADSTEGATAGAARFVVFSSKALNLAPGGAGHSEVYLRDTCGAAVGCFAKTLRVSIATGGLDANGDSWQPSMSAQGRFVAFLSAASNLVAGDTNGIDDVFLHDTCVGPPIECERTTVRVTLSPQGGQADGPSKSPVLSASGRYVAFASAATNLVSGDTNAVQDIFVRDTCVGGGATCRKTTVRASLSSVGAEANGASRFPSISANGRFVAFSSAASNLIAEDVNGFEDVFIRDTCTGAGGVCTPMTLLVSSSADGRSAQGASSHPTISESGRFVAFESAAELIPGGDPVDNVFLRDTCLAAPPGCTPATILISTGLMNTTANGRSHSPAIAGDGRFVVFVSAASNLVEDDANNREDVFLRDTCIGATSPCTKVTMLISVSSDGRQGNDDGALPSVSADGKIAVFESAADNLVGGDQNGRRDIFIAGTGY